MRQLPDLAGRLALVTGGGGSFGEAIATHLSAAGAAVALVGNDPRQLARIVTDIDQRGGAAFAVVRDLADLSALGLITSEVERDLGSIDILVNVQHMTPHSADASDAVAVEAALRINVVAPVVLSTTLAHEMSARGWGRIVNVWASGAGEPNYATERQAGLPANTPANTPAETSGGPLVRQPTDNLAGNAAGHSAAGSASSLCKAAIQAHTFNLAAELSSSGVTVNLYRHGPGEQHLDRNVRGSRFPKVTDSGVCRHPGSTRVVGCAACSAHLLVSRLDSDHTGLTWDFHDETDEPCVMTAAGVDLYDTSLPRDASWIRWFPAALPEWLSR